MEQAVTAFDPEATLRPRPLRVLVADDDKDAVATLAQLLNEEGHRVREVFRGDAVLHEIRDFRPDALLLDIGMPGMTGYDVAREVRAVFLDEAPVLIAVTGWNKSADKVLGKIAGFDEYVTKPYDPRVLLAILAALSGERFAAAG